MDAVAQAAVSIQQPPSPVTQVLPQTWAPQLIRGDRPVHVRGSANSLEAALALAQGLLIPVDMQKEAGSTPDRLVSTVSGIKVICASSSPNCHFLNTLLYSNFYHTRNLPVYSEDGGTGPKNTRD